AEEVEHRPFKREAQRTLAREMTTLVHGKSAVEQAELAAQVAAMRAASTAAGTRLLAREVKRLEVRGVVPGQAGFGEPDCGSIFAGADGAFRRRPVQWFKKVWSFLRCAYG
ncbi:hypothetical protein DLJ54_09405, partial [Corynebacterium heidelbergense]